MGGFSRENWFKEAKLKAKANINKATEEELYFLKKRKLARLTYKFVFIGLLISLPFVHSQIILIIDRYLPILLSYWLEIIIIIFFLFFVRMLNSLLNLEILVKKLKSKK